MISQKGRILVFSNYIFRRTLEEFRRYFRTEKYKTKTKADKILTGELNSKMEMTKGNQKSANLKINQ